MNKNDQEEFYDEIMELYDLAESVLDVLEYGRIKQPRLYVELCSPAIEQMRESVAIIAGGFMRYVESEEEEVSSKDTREIESAIRKIYTTIEDLTNKIEAMYQK